MDIFCPKCAEPWELDSLHDLVSERHDRGEWLTNGQYDQSKYDVFFAEVRQDFRKNGCAAFRSWGSKCNPERVASSLIGEILDLAGDDIDGAVSDLDDARRFFGDHFKVIEVPFVSSGAGRREAGEDFSYAVESEDEWI